MLAPQAEVQSPFLPGTQIQYAWDSTSLGDLKMCPRFYYLNMIEGWKPKDENIHLRFGGEYHAAIETYDKLRAEGADFDGAVRETIRQLLIRIAGWDPDTETKAGKYKNPRTLVQLVVDYLDFFRDDPAETFILENGKPAVELSFKFELDWGPREASKIEGGFETGQPYVLCGHLDRVVTYGGANFVLDHKTTTTTPSSYYFDGFNPHNQMTLYTLASQVVYHAQVKGVIVEAAQILLEKPNHFERGFSYRTQDQLDEWVMHLEYWLSQAEGFALSGHWPMNDTACDKFGGCRFRGVCSKSPQVREKWLRADFVQLPLEERWNPLKPR